MVENKKNGKSSVEDHHSKRGIARLVENMRTRKNSRKGDEDTCYTDSDCSITPVTVHCDSIFDDMTSHTEPPKKSKLRNFRSFRKQSALTETAKLSRTTFIEAPSKNSPDTLAVPSRRSFDISPSILRYDDTSQFETTKKSDPKPTRVRYASVIVAADQEVACSWKDTASTVNKLVKETKLSPGDYFFHFKNESMKIRSTIRLFVEARNENGESILPPSEMKYRVPASSTFTNNFSFQQTTTLSIGCKMKGKIMKKGPFELTIYKKRSRGFSLSPQALGLFADSSNDKSQLSPSVEHPAHRGRPAQNVSRIRFTSFDVIDTEATENLPVVLHAKPDNRPRDDPSSPSSSAEIDLSSNEDEETNNTEFFDCA